ncbi:MAG TPA: ABC transporter transmembrane domain-containing protein [Ktedonobacteraceae bacterium]|nr:ABC transporter transmembrane domain-containing protein [Ktedonobacteraceae bacterium]
MGFLLGFLNRNLKGYRLLVLIAFIMTAFEVLAALLPGTVIKAILDKVQFPGKDSSDWTTGILNLFDPTRGQPHNPATTILILIAILIVLGALDSALSYGQQFIATTIAQNLSARLRKNLFDQLQRLTLDWHGRQKKGDLVQRITGDIASIEKLLTDGLVDLMGAIFTFTFTIILLVVYQAQLTVVSVLILPALFVIILSYTKGIKAAAKRAAKAVGEVAEVATEDVGAITVLKAFSLEDREAERFNRYVGKSREAALEAGALQAQFTPVVNILLTTGIAIILGVGGFAAATGKFPLVNIPTSPLITVGTLSLFLGYLKQLYQPMKDFSKLTNVLTSAIAGAERIQEVYDQAPEVKESTTPYAGPKKLTGDILFENVVFGYTPDRPILKGINLHIAAGKKVALVGLSGGGKTTLVKLIPRFYEAQQGYVKIDGIDNRNIPLDLLRRNVTQVLQESVLFEGTILDNIKIGRPEATMDEIVAAAKQAQIHETILSMPDGYNTKVRERGKNFSGGQRQRLAIARAILCDSPILVLDEPTAALDVEAEAEVLHAIDELVVGRTVLMISHRLSTLGNVDEIIVLKDGRIVEQGPYKELKRQNGIFAGLLKEQNRYNIDYSGGSLIVPKAELQRLLNQQRQAAGVEAPRPSAPIVAPVGRPESVPVAPGREYRGVIGGNGRTDQPLRARVLIEVDGKIVGERKLDKSVLTVGRLASNDIPVPSQRVSRLHAKIRWDKGSGSWVIEDAESLNGLTYQGNRVDQHSLSRGDRIYIAPTAVVQYEPL